MIIRLASCSALTLGLAALPASAQITADDVWTNTGAYVAALGGRHTASLTRSGSVLSISGMRVEFTLPMGIGSFAFIASPMTLTEAADGSVTLTYSAPFVITVSATLAGAGTGSATFVIGPDPITAIATGTPGDITYHTLIDEVLLELYDYILPPDADDLDVSADIRITLSGIENTARIVEGPMVTLSTDSSFGPFTSLIDLTGPDGFRMHSETTSGPSTSRASASLPAGGSDILNLAPALRDGLRISAVTHSGGSSTTSVTEVGGQLSDRQHITSSGNVGEFTLADSGLTLILSVTNVIADIEQPDALPAPIGFDLSNFALSLQLPVLAGPEPQGFAKSLDISDLRFSPTIWSLFDPDKQLPRTPAQIAIRLDGTMVNRVEWLDFASLTDLGRVGDSPVTLNSLNISDLTLAALGARISGGGAFTFDNTNTTTYDGLPLPIGQASLLWTGVNGAIDTLAEANLIPSDALFGIRMGLGMITTPGDGDDVLTSTVDMTSDGQIIANGVRLR